MKNDSDLDKAKLFIDSISAALAKGIKHYSRSGTRLMTAKEVLQCLCDEGGFVIEADGATKDRFSEN